LMVVSHYLPSFISSTIFTLNSVGVILICAKW
jgi:hypothetical protein